MPKALPEDLLIPPMHITDFKNRREYLKDKEHLQHKLLRFQKRLLSIHNFTTTEENGAEREDENYSFHFTKLLVQMNSGQVEKVTEFLPEKVTEEFGRKSSRED